MVRELGMQRLLHACPHRINLADLYSERREAQKRQRTKASAKKASAEASRKTAEEKVRAQQEQMQTLRSQIFDAARKGDAATVRKGVWEQNVDAAGGEIRQGSEAFAKSRPADPKETLMHIAARNGDLDLVEYLGKYSTCISVLYRVEGRS